jgi:hypothetical protein
MKLLQAGCAVAIALGMVCAAYAHHSAAGIDQGKQVTVEGVVKTFKWANPHSWIELETPNPKGGVDVRNFEMNPPSYLVKAGWKSTTIKAGDKVKITYSPMKDTEKDGLGGLFRSITLADGKTLGQTPPRGGPTYNPQ